MRPEPKHRRSKQSARRAAQTLLRAAFDAWRGFPVRAGSGFAWCVVPRGGAATAGPQPFAAAWLREAAAAARELPSRFPRVLRQLVGDVEAWRRGCVDNFAALRAALDGEAPLPTWPPSIPSAALVELPVDVAQALAWTFAFDPLGFQRALASVAKLAAAARAAGLTITSPQARVQWLQWLELLTPMQRSAAPIWSLWAIPAAWTTPMAVAGDPSTLASRVFELLPAVAGRPGKARHALLEVIGALASPGIPSCLEEWRARALATGRDRARRFTSADALASRSEWLGLVEDAARLAPATLSAMADVLRRLPDVLEGRLVRFAFVEVWCRGAEPQLREWLEEFARYLRGTSDPTAALWPWRPFVRSHRSWLSPCACWLAQTAEEPRVAATHCFAVLRRMSARDSRPVHRRDRQPFDAVLAICRHASDATVATAFASALRATLRSPSTPPGVFDQPIGRLVPCALGLAGGDPERFARVVLRLAQDEALVDLCCEDRWRRPMPLPRDASWLGAQLATDAEVEIATVRRLLRSLMTSSPSDVAAAIARADAELRADAPAPGEWPAEVEPHIAALFVGTPAAGSAARAMRHELLPDPDALRTELSELVRLLPTTPEPKRTHLERRRASLQARLDVPIALRATAVTAWMRRVERRADRLRLAAWDEALRRPRRAVIEGALGCSLPTAWWRDPTIAEVLTGLDALPAEFLELAGAILSAGARGSWRGHLDHSRNREWIDRTRAAGIEIDVWLRGPEPLEVEVPKHGCATLAVASDPLDVLRCGAWFVTCLRPGGENFFSTVVLAADANKHVLILRGTGGAVLGRCVFALDRENRLRAFEPYCHDPTFDFAAMVERVGRSWATAMAAPWPGAAPVDVLTASRWYDDGNARLHRQIATMLAEPGVAASLQTGPDDALVELLRTRFGDDVLRSQVAAVAVVSAPCVADSPRLAGPLLAQCSLPHGGNRWELEQMLTTALASRHRDAIVRIVEHASRTGLQGEIVAGAWLFLDDPVRALRSLYPQGRWRRWSANPDLAYLAAGLHERLFRRRRALELYESVVARAHPSDELHALARAHRDRLAGELRGG